MINVDFTNIDNSKLVGRLLPFWARGRKMSLFLQALLSPLVYVHGIFQAWALQRLIECSITAQRASIEWYLKYKLKSHFYDESSNFVVTQDVNELLSCFSTGTWNKELPWHNDLKWRNDGAGGEYEEYLDKAGQTFVYAPAIVGTTSYDSEDYGRDIRYIISKYMINFNKVNIIIADLE